MHLNYRAIDIYKLLRAKRAYLKRTNRHRVGALSWFIRINGIQVWVCSTDSDQDLRRAALAHKTT